jgi:hypothetical protein
MYLKSSPREFVACRRSFEIEFRGATAKSEHDHQGRRDIGSGSMAMAVVAGSTARERNRGVARSPNERADHGDRQLARGALCRGDPQYHGRGHGDAGPRADAHPNDGAGLSGYGADHAAAMPIENLIPTNVGRT